MAANGKRRPLKARGGRNSRDALIRGKLMPQMMAMTTRPRSAEFLLRNDLSRAGTWSLWISDTARNFQVPPPGDYTRNL